MWIVEALNVIEDVGSSLVARAVASPMYSLDLQTREEALHGRVVPDVASSTHAALDAVIREEQLIELVRVLGALVRVLQQSRWSSPPSETLRGVVFSTATTALLARSR